MTSRIFAFGCLLAFTACPPSPKPTGAPDASDSGPPIAGYAPTCDGYCRRERDLGLPAGLPSPRLGVTCESRCASECALNMCPPIKCVVSKRTADEARACEVAP